jgi:ABC-2 type transport system ATP-binding protein
MPPVNLDEAQRKTVIRAVALTKAFGTFRATDNVTFAVPQGEIFGLLGPNGAGKSTTFKMLCGLLVPTSGEASVLGIDLGRQASAARQRLGYMAQKFSLYGNLSVQQNLEFFSGVYGLRGKAQRTKIDEMVRTFALEPFRSTAPTELSLGFKQRLALACALMHDPAVLFLDEPTSGVDPVTRREFWSHINGVVQKGVTVMVTTHFMDEAEYCDRIGLVYRGQMIAVGPPDDLKHDVASAENPDPTMEDAFITLVERSSVAEPAAAA